jgi:hypothetical protein
MKLCAAAVVTKVTEPVHAPDALHAHVPPLGQVVAQSMQTPPVPHAAFASPVLQVPAAAAEQQPPLQAWVAEQLDVHE